MATAKILVQQESTEVQLNEDICAWTVLHAQTMAVKVGLNLTQKLDTIGQTLYSHTRSKGLLTYDYMYKFTLHL